MREWFSDLNKDLALITTTITLVGTVLAIFWKPIKRKTQKVVDSFINKIMDDVKEIIKSSIESLTERVTISLNDIRGNVQTNKEAAGLLLRDRIISKYEYAIAKGETTTNELDEMLKLCAQYRKLKYNGIGDCIEEDIKRLKITTNYNTMYDENDK